ncbi:MAG TPA: copper chaperone PCu(A)C, partial [Sphingomicrobium sp.]|nr:copper chaperone PCu(A)C [Sphingomicrobium sp.]
RSIRVEGVASATVHESDMTDGVMRMRPVPELDLPSGATVTMAPGGLHIMLTGLKQPLKTGAVLRATLQFRQSPPLRLAIPVVSSKALEAAHGQH